MRSAEQISRRLKLRHLNVLVAVAEHGSMVKAAERLAVSQPVVSKAIADLEQLVGVRLLERGPHGIEPTACGRALLKRSAAIFDDLRASVAELESLADPGAGEVRIGATETMAVTLVPAIVNRLSRLYPRMLFEVVLGDPTRLVHHELRGRRVDLIIGRLALTHPDEFGSSVLFQDRLYVVAGLTNLWARRRKVALADLVKERWALPPPEHAVGTLIFEAFRRNGLPAPQRSVAVQSGTCTATLVAGGQYLGVLGQSLLGFSHVRSLLKILPVELISSEEPVRILTLKNRPLSPAARLFVDCALELAKPFAKSRDTAWRLNDRARRSASAPV